MINFLKNTGAAILPGYFFDRKKAVEVQNKVTTDISGQKGVDENTTRSHVATQDERVRLLKNYKGPVYLVQGREDAIGESTAYEIKNDLPQTEIHFIEKAGHFPWPEDDEQVKEFYSIVFKWLK